MAYRKRATGSRKTYSSRRKSPSRSSRTTTKRRKAAPRQQTMKIVVEVAPQNPVQRPDVAGLSLVPSKKGKAKM